ncbi:tRNA dimethylallyltransferase [Desulfoluna spongiiphila]|uniref:tRNA dimethylallyltransferase n=2 Tax=Desulfoluna spongiiphila TaxID=419481 RepID=A0A1G5ALZ1_9BACT|nr:tRNA (adenosine(37)-N6)-dimethylallyltransferase MiaA [Desulfoluna spongiiphila]SCX78855.1 tRNA dimethylallyltransferase [Desulfoluna spongiiphila]
MNRKIVVICGPTGVGKTSAAIEVCRRFKGEVVGADSMQVYRQMDIGTAKPTDEEQRLATHHMIDVVDPDEPYDAARFASQADAVIESLGHRGVLPVVAGGTGLYVKALVHGLSEAIPSDPVITERLTAEALDHGPAPLYKRLVLVDPAYAEKISENDALRIVRALSVFEATGKPFSAHHAEHGFTESRYEALMVCLFADREVLYDRINRRVDLMVEQGLLAEVKDLLARGYHRGLKSMGSIGYRHMVEHLEDGVPWEETVRLLKRDTRRFAKRQLTWFRADPDMIWLDPGDTEGLFSAVESFIA